jgi:outer membrane protein assembly factor BamB
MKRTTVLAMAMWLFVSLKSLYAGDWPMWRCDAARSAASPDGIATNLTLLWSRKLPPVRPAWPLDPEQRLNFDASYEPVVMGKLLFLGSPNDGSVTAYETETGAERWKFYTEAPVRCATAGWQGRVYAGSDDGFLYCLDAQTGKLRWTFRGAPANRPNRYQVGNGHLVSLWPVRGGPVVVSNTICFAAGVWSMFGVYVHALDAETGKLKWTNDQLHYVLTCVLGQRGSESGVSPQGHLVAIRDRLVIPNGRAMPAGLELATGKLIYYMQGGRDGGSRVAAHGEYAFVGRERLVNLYDFREAGSPWAYKGNQAPEGYFDSWAWYDWFKFGLGKFETCFLDYKEVNGCDASSAFADGVAYGAAQGVFYAYDLTKAQAIEQVMPSDHGQFPGLKWQPPLLWEAKTPYAGQAGNLIIKAGNRLFGGAGKKLLALENLAGKPRVAWETDLDGQPSSLIAADNKLFVATAEGGIYCFGSEVPGQAHANASPPPHGGASFAEARYSGTRASASDVPALNSGPFLTEPWTAKAKAVIAVTGVNSGYCLVLGLTDGGLVEALLRQTNLLVIAVDPDAKKIAALRRRYSAAGWLGSRVQLFAAKPFEFLFPPYLASLIVSEDARAAGFSARVDAGRLFSVLRPYGGTLCLELPESRRLRFEDWAEGAGATNAVVKRDGAWAMLIRAGALPGSAPWTHECADAAGTLCSQDDLVKAPLGVLWYGDMNNLLLWKGGNRAQVNGGRVYVLKPSRTVELSAYDAYTGRYLWRIHEKSATRGHARFAAMDDGIYMAMDGKCTIYDPETGVPRRSFPFNQTGAIFAKDVRVEDDVILVACDEVKASDMNDVYWGQQVYDSTMLVCLDRQTGAELWRRAATARFNNNAIAMGAGLVFCVDSCPMWDSAPWKQRRGDRKELESTVLALERRTGAVAWSKKMVYRTLRGPDEGLVYIPARGMLVNSRFGLMHAWAARTGEARWENKKLNNGYIIARGDSLIGFFCQYAGTG